MSASSLFDVDGTRQELLSALTEQWQSSALSAQVDVLCMEDDETQQMLLRADLEQLTAPALLPTFVETLADALQVIGRYKFDAVLVDLNLPDSTGLATVQRVCAVAPDLPVIALSGRQDAGIARQALVCGAQDFVFKQELNGVRLARSILYAIERQRQACELEQRRRVIQLNEARLSSIVNSSVDAILVIDAAGVVSFANPAAASMFGRSQDELCGQQFGFSSQSAEGTEIEIVRRNGELGVAELRCVATTWHDQPATLTTLRDVTQRRRAAEALKTSQAQLLAALEAGGMGTWSWDVAADRWSWDEASVAMWECDAAQLADANLDLLVSMVKAEFQSRLGSAFEEVRNGIKNEVAVEFCVQHAGREGNWLLLKGRLEHSLQDSPARMTGICMDISVRARSEELSRRSQKLEALGTLSGGIAHDFNNILLAISANASLLAQELAADHPLRDYVSEIQRSSSRATDLVRRILSFSRPVQRNKSLVDLPAVIEEAVKLTRATQPAMIEIIASFPAHLPPIVGDATEIHQIAVNLITNAAHAIGRRQGKIEVKLERALVDARLVLSCADLRVGEYARLSVTDNGCGIDKASLKRIFDPFFTTKAPGEGTGLGLSVVHGIMRSHEGAIDVHSAVGRGTTFLLYFPAAEQTAPSEAVVVAHAKETCGKGERVLYVDDDPALVFIVPRLLQRHGYKVTAFADTNEVVQVFRDEPAAFDVVVTDMSMPGMTGFELAEKLLGIRPDLPILMMSGYVRAEDEERAERVGIRQIMYKADTMDALSAELEQLLARLRGGMGGESRE